MVTKFPARRFQTQAAASVATDTLRLPRHFTEALPSCESQSLRWPYPHRDRRDQQQVGHRYLPSSSTTTRGRLVWPAVARDKKTLNGSFDLLGEERCATIRLVSADAASYFPPPWRNSVPGHGSWSRPAMQSSNSSRTCAAVRFHVNSSAWDFAFARSSSETRLATSTARASASGPEPSITVA